MPHGFSYRAKKPIMMLLFVASVMILIMTGPKLTRLWNDPQVTQFNDLLKNHDFSKARNLIEQRISRSPDDGENQYLKARLELAVDNPEQAMEAMRKAVTLGYPEAKVQVLRALLLARAGKLPEAESILLPAFYNKTGPEAEVAEGLTLIYLGKMQLAEATKAIELWKLASPLDDRPYLMKNEIDDRTNSEPDVLIENYQEALSRNPSNQQARIALAQIFLKANRLEEAEREFQKAADQENNNPQIPLGLAQVSLLKGNTEKAAELFDMVLQITPDNSTALAELSQIELQTGKIDQAITHLKHAITINPYDSELCYKLSQALKLQGNDTAAREMLEKSKQLKADEERIQDLRKVLVQEPDNIEARVEAAQWLISHGHEKEGLEWAQLVLKQKPGYAPLCQFLYRYYYSNGNHGLANYYRAMTSGLLDE
jgi:tetratricopeptide (TPR) repeat protein